MDLPVVGGKNNVEKMPHHLSVQCTKHVRDMKMVKISREIATVSTSIQQRELLG